MKLSENKIIKKPLIVAVIGLIGSGKTEAVSRFVAAGFERVGFNDPTYEELERRGLERVEKHERMVREELRQKEGMAVMAQRSLPKVKAALSAGKNVVIESLYSWAEYKTVKEKFGKQFGVLAIFAPPEVRYARLATRAVRPLTRSDAVSRDYAQIENLDQAGPIAMADWTIQNTKSKEEFFQEIDTLIHHIN